jgi:SM-20-related protein
MPIKNQFLAFETIADGLAGKGYVVIDQFLGDVEVRQILNLGVFQSESMNKAGIGKENRQFNESIRGDSILWLDRHTVQPALALYLNRLDELRIFLNQSLFLSLKDYEVHLAWYPAGAFYKRHLDQFRSDDHRKLSAILYLNEDWQESDGGQLRMYLNDETHDFFPIAGRLVCFRSDLIEHEVLPATRERLSITGWLLDQLSDLRHL